MNIDLDPTIAAILEGAGFTAHKQLGKGTFGSVYHCTTADSKDVAIKVVTGDQEREMTAVEAEIMTLMRPHPNIIPLISFEEYSECSLMALPLAAGGDTLKLMQERSLVPLPFEDARNMFIQLVDAVSHMHKEGFVHRDIKCENVLLAGAKRRTVQLADFGFATRWSESSHITEPWGSLHYSSPEIVSRVPYRGPEVDVWSLGVVLYAWCTGRLPFSGNGEPEIAARINAGSFIIPTTLPSDLADLIACMLTPDPRKRITTADIKKHPWCAARTNALLRNCHMERCPSDPSVLVKHQQQRQLKADGEAEPKERHRSTSLSEIAQPSRLAKVGARLARAFRIEKK